MLEHARLDLLVRGGAIGLGHVERDLAGGEGIEHHRRKPGEAEPALDETHGEPEAARDRFDIRTVLDELLEG